MIAGVVSFSSCKKDDTTAPTITVSGGNAQNVSLNSTWSNPSATASDDVDGDVSTTITVGGDVVNPNITGIYNVTYTVSDAAGNTSTETVQVTVVNDASFLGNVSSSGVPTSANYAARDTCQVTAPFNYSPTVLVSSTTNNAFVITNFGGFGTTITVSATRSGNTINIPASQTLGGGASIVAASGTITSSTAPVRFTITYTWTDGSATEVCNSVYTHQ